MAPEDATEFPTQPLIKIFKHILHFGQTKIVEPSPQDSFQAFNRVSKASAPSHSENHLHLGFESFHRLRRDPQPRLPMSCHRIAEKSSLPRPFNLGLLLVHLQLQLLLQESGDRFQHTLSGLLTAYVDAAIICITTEAKISFLQFLIKIIQEDVRQERRERAALRRPPAGGPKSPHRP